mgnify:CR=1 FL=1|tara:strand:- start:644 stop:883 length:240 start_codon:yes stop_codon:yes gene_type:complete
MFSKKEKKFTYATRTIEFSAYSYNNLNEPVDREVEMLEDLGSRGYELVNILQITNKDREDEEIPYHCDRRYYFKKEIIK